MPQKVNHCMCWIQFTHSQPISLNGIFQDYPSVYIFAQVTLLRWHLWEIYLSLDKLTDPSVVVT
jgi:hypothetical protein